MERAFESADEDGHGEAGDLAHPSAAVPPQATGQANPPGILDHLRGEGERHDDGCSHLVERGGDVAQQPTRAGQGVRRAEAGQHGGEAKPVVRSGEDALGRDRSAEPQATGPRGQGQLREADEDGAPGHAPTEQGDHDDAQTHREHPHEEERREGVGGAHLTSFEDDPSRDRHHEHEQERVGGARGSDGQTRAPHPPGGRMEQPGHGGGASHRGRRGRVGSELGRAGGTAAPTERDHTESQQGQDDDTDPEVLSRARRCRRGRRGLRRQGHGRVGCRRCRRDGLDRTSAAGRGVVVQARRPAPCRTARWRPPRGPRRPWPPSGRARTSPRGPAPGRRPPGRRRGRSR